MTRVTYLLGAGASANALPIYYSKTAINTSVKDFLGGLENFKSVFNSTKSGVRNENGEDEKLLLIGSIQAIIDQLQLHNSIDTIAKKYYLLNNEKNNLKILKIIISLFFLFEQTKPEAKLDQRYDTFFASLLERGQSGYPIMSNEFNIITWNYDIQLELAYANYCLVKDLRQLQKQLNVFPSLSNSNKEDFNINEFCIVHLNGIAGLGYDPLSKSITEIIDSHLEMGYQKLIDSILNAYSKLTKSDNGISDLFSYSWEESELSLNARKIAFEMLDKTDKLVVIGYSFPYFNKGVDYDLIEIAKIRVAEMYIQDKNPDLIIKLLKERHDFQLGDAKLIPINQVDRFHIPSFMKIE